tara:strand:+ start:448 stop:717 length:270 start_codon:yes stop_codon:yes gene_type:complete
MFNFQKWIEETDPKKLKAIFESLLLESGFNIEGFIDKKFTPHGWTALWLLSESHFAIHTFPEHGKSYIELSSCIDKPYNDFIDNYNKAF